MTRTHPGILHVSVYIILAIFIATMASTMRPREIPLVFKEVATEQGVPASMLYAISVVESGGNPWVLCVKGKGHFYETREDAYAAFRQFRARGITNIDVGIMQINWKYHHQRFIDDWQMFDERENIKVGAEILRECYDKTGDWLKAVGCYHSPAVKWRANKYRDKVIRVERYLDATTEGVKRNDLSNLRD